MLDERQIVENVFYYSAILIGSNNKDLSKGGFEIIARHNFKKRFDVVFDKILPLVDDGFVVEFGSLTDFVFHFGVDQQFKLSEVLKNSKSEAPPHMVRIFVPEGFTKDSNKRAKTVILIVSDKKTITHLVSAIHKSTNFARNITLDIGNYVLYDRGKDFFTKKIGDFFSTPRKPGFRHYEKNNKNE